MGKGKPGGAGDDWGGVLGQQQHLESRVEAVAAIAGDDGGLASGMWERVEQSSSDGDFTLQMGKGKPGGGGEAGGGVLEDWYVVEGSSSSSNDNRRQQP